MNSFEKWEDITLMNSKCSEMSGDGHSQIYRAVIKSLKEDKCNEHNEKY